MKFIPVSTQNTIIIIQPRLNLKTKHFLSNPQQEWDFDKSQIDLINGAIENFDWNKLGSAHNINNQVNFF